MTDLSLIGLTEGDVTEEQPSNLSALGISADDLTQSIPADAMERFVPPQSNIGVRGNTGLLASMPQKATGTEMALRDAPAEANKVNPVLGQALDLAAAFNRGMIGIVDLPANLFNMASAGVTGIMGGDNPPQAARVSDIPLVKSGTTGGQGPEGAVPEALELATEFMSGGLGVQGVASRLAAGTQRAAAAEQTVANRALEEVSKIRLAQDAKIAAGGGAALSAVNHNELLADSMLAQILAPIVGGLAVAAPGAMASRVAKSLPGAQKQTRAASILMDAVDDPDAAVGELLKKRVADIGPAASGDLGVMTLARSLARENPLFEGKLNDKMVLAQRTIQSEIDTLFTPDGSPISPTAAQDFLKQNSQELIRQLDDRVKIALDKTAATASLGRDQLRDIDISRQGKAELLVALQDVSRQNDINWTQVGKEVPIPTEPVKQVAMEIVQNARKATELPVKSLELILKRKVTRTKDGWKVGDKELDFGYEVDEPVGELLELRSNLLAELRVENKDAIATKQAPFYSKLQGAVVDAIEGADPQGVDAGLWRAATSYTRRMHEVFDQGIIGRLLTSSTKGGDAIASEKTFSTLLAGGREQQAAGIRELFDVAAMREQAAGGGGNPYKSQIIRQAQEYLSAKFQQSVKNAEDAANFLVENEEALREFPKLQQTLSSAAAKITQQSGKINALEAGKSAIEKSAFTKFSGVNGKKAINIILSQRDPAKFSRQLKMLMSRDATGDAVRGLQREIADTVIERSLTASSAIPAVEADISKRMLARVTKQLEPVLKQFYTPEMLGNVKLIQAEVGKMHALKTRQPQRVKVPRSMIMDLMARSTGAHLAAKLVQGSGAGPSLIAAKAGSEAGREIVFAIPESATRAVLEEAMLNRNLLLDLLKRGMTVEQQNARMRKTIETVILQNVGPQAANDFTNNLETLQE